jgi:beta-lactamase class A
MMRSGWCWLLVFAGAACAPGPAGGAAAPGIAGPRESAQLGTRAQALEKRLAALAGASGGTVAVTVLHLPSGERASVNGGKRLPMMSVFKLPLALVTLAAVDEGRRTMSEPVPLSPEEIRPTISPVAEAWAKGEKAPPLETILRTAIQDSDNTSGDKLVTLNGGGPAITARLRAMGIEGVDVAEQEVEIHGRIGCAGTTAPRGGWIPAALGACKDPGAEAQLAAARREVDASPNGATSDALVAMLARLDRGEVLSTRSRTWLTATLEGARTGTGRIKGRLPAGTRVGHKTGTGETIEGLNVATNDVGIVYLPDGSRLALAVLTSGVRGTDAARDAVIAGIAREVYDAFAP